LYAHFVEPHLADSRDNWDNLSHGSTYTEPSEAEKEMAQKALENEKTEKEAEARKKSKEAKAKDEKGKERAKSADKQKGEKKGHDQDRKSHDENKDKKPVEKGEAKEENQQEHPDNKTTNGGKKKEDQSAKQSDAKLKDGDNQKEKKIQRRSDDQDSNPRLKEAQKVAWESFEHCRRVCEENKDCFQFVYYDKTCKIGFSFRLGKYVAPSDDGKTVWKSGWMVSRIRQWTKDNACHGPEWPNIE
jgi:hypothetical protein